MIHPDLSISCPRSRGESRRQSQEQGISTVCSIRPIRQRWPCCQAQLQNLRQEERGDCTPEGERWKENRLCFPKVPGRCQQHHSSAVALGQYCNPDPPTLKKRHWCQTMLSSEDSTGEASASQIMGSVAVPFSCS